MKKIKTIGFSLLFIILIAETAFILCQNKSEPVDVSANLTSNQNQLSYMALARPTDKTKKTPAKLIDDEETVVLNVSNIGRSNPFRPYTEKSLIMNSVPIINIPQPPQYSPDPNFTTLFGIKVSGILYDTRRPSAIINVDNTDYLVHKGDFLFNFYVKDITVDKIAVKYGNNVYKAGIGEVIEGIVNINPVNNRQLSGNTSGAKFVNPVDLPTLPTLR
jgi:hypothetical protein